jgi:hypothetical protein
MPVETREKYASAIKKKNITIAHLVPVLRIMRLGGLAPNI